MGKKYTLKQSPKSEGVMVTGVVTRAKSKSAASYIQLRNRLVVRKPVVPKRRRPRVNRRKSRVGMLVQNSPDSVNSGLGVVGGIEGVGENEPDLMVAGIGEGVGGDPVVADQVVQGGGLGQIGEGGGIDRNAPEPEVRIQEETFAEMDRWARESTPPHLIRDPSILVPPPPPGRRARAAGVQMQPQLHVENTIDFPYLNASFSELEATDRQMCIDKYNFDPLTETPLAGRYEWEKVDPNE